MLCASQFSLSTSIFHWNTKSRQRLLAPAEDEADDEGEEKKRAAGQEAQEEEERDSSHNRKIKQDRKTFGTVLTRSTRTRINNIFEWPTGCALLSLSLKIVAPKGVVDELGPVGTTTKQKRWNLVWIARLILQCALHDQLPDIVDCIICARKRDTGFSCFGVERNLVRLRGIDFKVTCDAFDCRSVNRAISKLEDFGNEMLPGILHSRAAIHASRTLCTGTRAANPTSAPGKITCCVGARWTRPALK